VFVCCFCVPQGGIIYKAPGDDEADVLAADIQKAGAGECTVSAVKLLATEVRALFDDVCMLPLLRQ